MRGGEQDLAAFAQHRAEIRLRRLCSQAKEGQACRFQDHPAHRCRHGDHDHRQNIRQDFDEQDLSRRFAGKPCRVDKLPTG